MSSRVRCHECESESYNDADTVLYCKTCYENIGATVAKQRKLLEEVVHLHNWGGAHTDWMGMIAKIEKELSDD